MTQRSGISAYFRLAAGFFGLLFSALVFSASDEGAEPDYADIIERIAPAGSVCLVGESCAGGAVTVASVSTGGGQNPEQVYNTYCVACHGTGANNSPIMGDAAAWQPRLDQGMETLYQNAINGLNNNAMPAKGLCMACSDDDIRATVDYILSALQ